MRTSYRHVAAAALCALAVTAAQAEDEKVLNVYNWSDYIAADTIARFEQETGIKVRYDVYDSNEILEAKLTAGSSGYDVVFPSASPFLARQVKAGIYQELDRARLPGWKDLDPKIVGALAVSDPGNRFAVPYMVAGTGIGVNVAKVRELAPDAPLDSWALVFEPKWTNKLKVCGMTLLDDSTEAVPGMLAYLGLPPASEDTKDLDAAMDRLAKVRKSFKYIHSSAYINDLANGDICLAHGYGGDLIQARDRAREAKRGVDIKVFFPKEGVQIVIDVMAIPKDAPHVDNAHRFIAFMMRPDVVGPITNAVGYANAIRGAEKFTDPERLSDPVIYPPDEVRARFFVLPAQTRTYERARTRAWTRFKTGK